MAGSGVEMYHTSEQVAPHMLAVMADIKTWPKWKQDLTKHPMGIVWLRKALPGYRWTCISTCGRQYHGEKRGSPKVRVFRTTTTGNHLGRTTYFTGWHVKSTAGIEQLSSWFDKERI